MGDSRGPASWPGLSRPSTSYPETWRIKRRGCPGHPSTLMLRRVRGVGPPKPWRRRKPGHDEETRSPLPQPSLRAAEGGFARRLRAATVGGRGLFAGANGELLKAVSGTGSAAGSVAFSPGAGRFRDGAGYSAHSRFMLPTALPTGHMETILYRLYNPTSAGAQGALDGEGSNHDGDAPCPAGRRRPTDP